MEHTHWTEMEEYFLRSKDGEFLVVPSDGSGKRWVDDVKEASTFNLFSARVENAFYWNDEANIYPGEVPVITISPDDTQLVLSGDKVLTIRRGLRIYDLGDALMHDRTHDIVIPVTILRTSHCLIENTPIADLALTGNETHEELTEDLGKFYIGIEKSEPITIVRFERR